ncbi:MAG: YtxH domain-containing protein [Verrucomicrobiota bacterium]
MSKWIRSFLGLVLTVAMICGAGCTKMEEGEDEAGEAVEETGDAAEEATEEAADAVEETGDAAEEAGDEM